MKKLLAIMLTVCLVINMSGYHFFFMLYRRVVKKEMKAYIRMHRNEFNLAKFTVALKNGVIANNRLLWENDHEFQFEGTMYDVIEKHISGDKVTILCINDKKETALINHYQKIIKHSRHHPSKNRSANSLMQFLHNFFISEYSTIILLAPLSATQFITSNATQLPSVYREILTPPPQQLSALM